MTHPGSTRRAWVLLTALALALPWALACDDGGMAGPEAVAGIEDIPEAEIVAAGDLAGLTEEQREQVRRILRRARTELMALRRQVRAGTLSPEVARQRARAIHERVIEELSEILTEDQIEGLFQHLRERHQDRPDLDLTEAQREAIQALREEFRAFVRDVRGQVLDGDLTAAEARERIRAEWLETRAAICAVLTEDQAAGVRFCGGDPPPGPRGG